MQPNAFSPRFLQSALKLLNVKMAIVVAMSSGIAANHPLDGYTGRL